MSKKKPKSKISAQDIRFVNEYVQDFNGTRAAKRAYPKVKTDKSAATTSTNMLKKVEIQELIRENFKNTKELMKRDHNIDMKVIRKELAYIGFSRINNLVKWADDQVEFRPSEDIEECHLATVREVTRTVTTINEVETVKMSLKTYDKVAALKLLAKHMGMLDGKQDDDAGEEKRAKEGLDRRLSELAKKYASKRKGKK